MKQITKYHKNNEKQFWIFLAPLGGKAMIITINLTYNILEQCRTNIGCIKSIKNCVIEKIV